MRVDVFDFELPETSIALRPAVPRDSARLLVVSPPALSDRGVRDLPGLLRAGDCLVFNDTRVIPAALDGVRVRDETTAKVAFNLIKRVDARTWRAFARPAKRLLVDDRVLFGLGPQHTAYVTAHVSAKGEAGEVELAFDKSGPDLDAAIAAIGAMPLPPYIALKRPPEASDKSDYQTMFAARDGAVAAPTAALHFTPELLAALTARGVTHQTLTLHVGAGTFLPMKVEDTSLHKMHSEWGEIDAATAAALNAVKARGGRIVAVGTTSLRLLESAAQDDGMIKPFSGDTAIFITPGYRFKAVDALLSNFHLPKSTLFMLVCAFSGLDTMKAAYDQAIATGYRFYSYGDACLLFRPEA
ncbi:MAG: tRNA preQ1(34) S-adenosylmethionine ribosyltransferase-isomerase QueA [Hyphomicrobiaceae bacterium]